MCFILLNFTIFLLHLVCKTDQEGIYVSCFIHVLMFHIKICSNSAHCSLTAASCVMKVRSWSGKDTFTAFSLALACTFTFRWAQTAGFICAGYCVGLHPKPFQSSSCQVCWAADCGGNSVYAHPHSEGCATFFLSFHLKKIQRTFYCFACHSRM